MIAVVGRAQPGGARDEALRGLGGGHDGGGRRAHGGARAAAPTSSRCAPTTFRDLDLRGAAAGAHAADPVHLPVAVRGRPLPGREPAPRRRAAARGASSAASTSWTSRRARASTTSSRRRQGRGLVLSWHDLEGTPDDLEARSTSAWPRRRRHREDRRSPRARSATSAGCSRSRRATPRTPAPRLVALAMGPLGVASRVLGGRYGAPFTLRLGRRGARARPRASSRRAVLADSLSRALDRPRHARLRPARQRRAAQPLAGDPEPRVRRARDRRRLRAAAGRVARRLHGGAARARPLGLQRDAALQGRDPGATSTRSRRRPPRSAVGVTPSSRRTAGCVGLEHGRRRRARRRCGSGSTRRDARVAILGAGGAARAAAFALVRAGARVTCWRAAPSRPREVAAATGCAARAPRRRSPAVPYDVLVNATPLGSGAFPGESPAARERAAIGQRGVRHGLRAARDAAARARRAPRAARRSTASRCWSRRRSGSSRPGPESGAPVEAMTAAALDAIEASRVARVAEAAS